jgi:hypothetical protein
MLPSALKGHNVFRQNKPLIAGRSFARNSAVLRELGNAHAVEGVVEQLKLGIKVVENVPVIVQVVNHVPTVGRPS